MQDPSGQAVFRDIREDPDSALDWFVQDPSGQAVFRDIREDPDSALDWFVRENPDYLMTYPTYLGALVERSRERGVRPAALREAATFGESIDDGLRVACREHWGVPVFDVYSTQETGLVAVEGPEGGGCLVQAETVLIEVLRDDGSACAPGEIGRVVLTPLHNFAMPLIRYDIEDYAEVGPSSPCGRGRPALTRIAGRVRNMVRHPNGDTHWPTTSTFIALDFVRQYQIVQTSLSSLEVRLVAARPPGADGEAAMTAALADDLRYPFEVTFRYLDEIPPPPAASSRASSARWPMSGRDASLAVPRSGVPGILWPALPNQHDSLVASLLWQLDRSQWWP